MRPAGTSTLAVETWLRSRAASAPCTRNFAKQVWSNSATRSRTASHSARQASNQFCRPYEYRYAGCEPGAANQFGRSQPAVSPMQAPAATSRSCSGVRRAPRALRYW